MIALGIQRNGLIASIASVAYITYTLCVGYLDFALGAVRIEIFGLCTRIVYRVSKVSDPNQFDPRSRFARGSSRRDEIRFRFVPLEIVRRYRECVYRFFFIGAAHAYKLARWVRFLIKGAPVLLRGDGTTFRKYLVIRKYLPRRSFQLQVVKPRHCDGAHSQP